MQADEIWRTWKPYAVIALLLAGGIWWYNNQSSLATLKSGTYDCAAVFVNHSKKYETYTDESGQPYFGQAQVQGGEVINYSAPNVLAWQGGVRIVVRERGTSHFHATQDPAVHSYDALACDWSSD